MAENRSAEELEPEMPSTTILCLGPSSRRLGFDFFDQHCVDLAKCLLGKVLVRKYADRGVVLRGRVVETEAYPRYDDAWKAHNRKRTPRNEAMWMRSGTSYVYITQGIYSCFNISSKEDGTAVLVRAVAPLDGIEIMQENRRRQLLLRKKVPKKRNCLKLKNLCDGPSKLCISFGITKALFDQKDLTLAESELFLEDDGHAIPAEDTVEGPRIGVGTGAGEWSTKHLRFHVRDNLFVSRK